MIWKKTLSGISTKHKNRFLKATNIGSVFPTEGTLNLVHYNFDQTARVRYDLEQILELVGQKGGIQVNQPRGRLRTADNKLDLELAEQYVANAFAIFN